jgi:ATP-dependent DNA helicase RecG
LKWICGFANAQGRKIYIGMNDDGEVVGVSDSKKLLEDIPNKITQSLGIVADVNLLTKDGMDYIEIDVPAYSTSISYKGVYHYRSGSTKQVLTGPALESFLNGKRGVTWDNMPLPAFTMDDVEDSVINKFKELAAKKGRIEPSLLEEPKEVLLEKLHLTAGGYLTNAAMMLFAKDPEKWQLGAFVKIGYFESDADLMYQDEVRGSLIEIVDKIIELVYLKYMRAKISYVGMQRQERYFVPEAALRETLLNALCHSQYNYGVPIQISVYEDKMYIANCGQLPDNWTAESLLVKHASRPFNPNIANVFYLAGFIESWGRGIEKICEACKSDDLPEPEFTVNPGDIMVKFTAPADKVVRGPGKVTDGVTDGVTDEVTDAERRILNELKIDPGYSYVMIAENLGISKKTVAEHIKSLKEKGIIERVGNNKTGHWKINS